MPHNNPFQPRLSGHVHDRQSSKLMRITGLGVLVLSLAGCSGLVDRMPVEIPKVTPQKTAEPLTTSIGIRCSLVPAGNFWMGASDADSIPAASGERPRHTVKISKAFWMSQYEITVGQFRQFVNDTDYRTAAERSRLGCTGLDAATGEIGQQPRWTWANPGFPQTDQHPVVGVSWEDAQEFCRWLTAKEGRVCRLPTEAEWEYACRAGSSGGYFSGDQILALQGAANVGDQSLKKTFPDAQAVAAWNDGAAFTMPVGSFLPNNFDLYDTHGNVGEWCEDWFDATYYSKSPTVDPRGPAKPTQWHVVRGGSWYNSPVSCRSTGRHDGVSTAASTTNGFRIVIEQ